MRGFILILALLVCAHPVSAKLKKCVDKNGNYYYYDNILPFECQGKTTIEMNKQGVVINRDEEVAPHEANKNDDDEGSRHIEAQRQADKDKQDAVLLNIYTSAEEIDLARERNIHPITMIIAGIRKRLDIAQNRLADLQKQADTAKTMGGANLDSIQQEIIPAQKYVTNLRKELSDNLKRMEITKVKYDNHKERFLTLVEQKEH